MRKQAGVEKYAAGTNSSPEHPSGPQNQENPNLGLLDSLSPEKKSTLKRTKWLREKYKEVIIAFYQALNKPQNKNAKLVHEI